MRDLNDLYKTNPALYEKQFTGEGFEWINYSDHQNAVVSYIRKGNNADENLIVVCNFTPVIRQNYRIGISKIGKLQHLLLGKASVCNFHESVIAAGYDALSCLCR